MKGSTMRIVVFGAGGCVGGWICEELSQRPDIDQVPCVRKWASAVRLARRGIPTRQADLEDLEALPALVQGADVVINAAMPPPSREPALVEALYAACASANVHRFIQFSSAAVYGHSSGDVDEHTAPAPIDDYSRGKAEMETRLVDAAARSNTQLVVLRPSIVYGPFSGAWTVRYAERITKSRWLSLGPIGDGTCNLIHAHDLAKGVIAAATADIPPGTHVLNINGPDIVSWNEYIERLGDALDTAERTTPNAAWFRGMALTAEIMRIGGRFTSIRSLYRRSRGTTRATMTHALAATKLYPSLGELQLLGRKVRYSADHARQVLGFKPSIRLEEGLRQSVAWCKAHGVV
jgi:nucleoside-diphosphate-sugar epimerase